MTESTDRNQSASAKKPYQKKFSYRLKNWLRSNTFKCILMDIAAALIILAIFLFVCVPKTYDLSVNSVAPETIKATKDVVDEITTQQRREAAASRELKYKDTSDELIASLDSALDELRSIETYGASLHDADDPESIRQFYSEEEIEQAIMKLDKLTLDRDQLMFILQMSPSAFESMASSLRDAAEEELNNNTIREDQQDQVEKIRKTIRNKAELRQYQLIINPLLEICIQPNLIIDQAATEEAQQKAMDAVEPVIYQQGRTIVHEGDLVEEWQLSMMRSLGLLNDQDYSSSVFGGSAVVILIAMVCLIMSLKLLRAEILNDVRKMAVVLIILILCMAVAAVAHLLPSQYIIPLALGSILGTMLIGYRIGISITFTLTILFGAMTSGNSSSTFYDVVMLMSATIVEGIAVIWFLKGRPQRVRVLIAGLIASLLGVLLMAGLRWLTSSDTVDLLSNGAWTIGGGLLSGLLAVAFQPAIEQVFRLATPSRLLELTNPNQPLMKRLMIEAPGTYHHSIIVANLAEAAADKIQANPYLARAGAYYHDIGKLKRPGYFKENQNGDNPHERTDPYVSAAIVTSHTMDGVLLAQKEHMPKEVQDIILQHHGVTPVMFFYHKALQLSNGNHVDINEFRYDGPKPKTKEAAIVMLADTIEAAVRSMKDPTPKGIDQFIERLVRGKLEDGQLSESPLSLTDIDQICDAFSGILKGVYHERIEYPTVRHYAGQDVSVPETNEKDHTSVPGQTDGQNTNTVSKESQSSTEQENENGIQGTGLAPEPEKPGIKTSSEETKEDSIK